MEYSDLSEKEAFLEWKNQNLKILTFNQTAPRQEDGIIFNLHENTQNAFFTSDLAVDILFNKINLVVYNRVGLNVWIYDFNPYLCHWVLKHRDQKMYWDVSLNAYFSRKTSKIYFI